MTTTPTTPDRKRGRLALAGLAAVFLGPLVVAIVWYVVGGGPAGGGVNNGAFIEPPVTLDAREHFDTGLRGRWTLLVKAGDACGKACADALEIVRQVRLATGREIDRIERALLLPAGVTPGDGIVDADPGLVVLRADRGPGAPVAAALDALPPDHIYIVDPVGNAILRYPLLTERKPLLADLKKLLKLSRIG